MIDYLQGLADSVGAVVHAGDDLDVALERTHLPQVFASPNLPSPAAEMHSRLNMRMHRLNVVATYRALRDAPWRFDEPAVRSGDSPAPNCALNPARDSGTAAIKDVLDRGV